MLPVRIFYKSRLFVAGVTLLVLGVGNYLAAISKVAHYQQVVTNLSPQTSQPPLFGAHGDEEAIPSEKWERWEIARAKLDYYHVVLSGGQLMMSAGVGCLLLAFITLRRQRLRHTLTRRLTSDGSVQGPALTS